MIRHSYRTYLLPAILVPVFLIALGVNAWRTYAVDKPQDSSQPSSNTEATSIGRAQKGKFIARQYSFPGEPLELVEAKAKGIPIKLGAHNYGLDDDWLNGLSFKLKNKSDKVIQYIYATFFFPDHSSAGDLLIFPITLGADPKLGRGTPLNMAPGAYIECTLDGKRYEGLNRLFSHRNLSIGKINAVLINANQMVIFNDDTAFSVRSIMYRDPQQPNHWVEKP